MKLPILHSPITSSNGWRTSVWTVVAAFGTYFCMYGFRKPFASAEYAGIIIWGLSYKSVLITSQVLGYMSSKFLGIRFVTGLRAEYRVPGIIVLISISELALFLNGMAAPPWNVVFLFLNGLPLGMVFGLVLGFLEGRQTTEALTAGLCASFILADGVSKSAGAWLLSFGISEFWMPFTAGLIFLPPLLIFTAMLKKVPPPTNEDIAQRCERPPLDRAERREIFLKNSPGLTLLIGTYLFLTILRSVRADFAPEIWRGLGYSGQSNLFTQSELIVTLGVVFANGMAILIRDNRRAFFTALGVGITGFMIAGYGILGWRKGWIDGFDLMVLLGLGLYLPYVAVHTTIFERLIAMTGDRGNLGYLIYLADSFGYLGYVGVMLVRSFRPRGQGLAGENFLDFFIPVATILVILAGLMLVGSWIYFDRKMFRSSADLVAPTLQ